jgi:hypothetical protein
VVAEARGGAKARGARVVRRVLRPQALEARDYVERDWSGEQWSRGCYVGVTAPGVLLDYGPQIRTPSERIHWAGTETATIWNGYMEGAVQSGERAARRSSGRSPAGPVRPARKPKRRRPKRRRRRRGAPAGRRPARTTA